MNRITTIAVRHWKPLLGLNAILLAIASYSALTVPKVWTAKAELILPKSSSDLNANLGKLGDFTGGGVVFSQQVSPLKIMSSILTSNEVVGRVWASDPEKSLYSRLSGYTTLFEVSPQSETTVISLSAQGSNPELARKRAVALIEAFQQRLTELRGDDASQRSRFIQKELDQANQKLRQAQMALTEFKKSSNLVSNEDQVREIVATINTLTSAKTQALAQSQASEAQVKALSSRLSLNPDQAIRSLSLGENQDYQFIRQKLSQVEAALVESRSRFREEHPQVQKLRLEQEELRRQLQQYISQAADDTVGVNTTVGENSGALIQQLILAESEVKAQRSQAEQIQRQIDQMNAQLRTLPKAQERLMELQRQYDIAEGVYNGLVAQVQGTKLNAFSSYPSVQLLDQPTVDPKPSGPGRRPIAVGAILGCVFGSIALALFLESRNPLLSPRDLQTVGIPLLRSIPRFQHLTRELDSRFETAVEFQRLASAVSMMQLEKRRLMISSATAGEGKTTVTIGLATALVTLGFRVLIVDGDFRKAELSRRLGCSQEAALNSKLTPVPVRPRLDLLPTKPQKDKIAEFVARGGFEQCLNAAQSIGDYDYVIVDSAPVSLTSEAALMATVVPNILLVVWPGLSNRNPFNDSIEQLTRHKAKIVGLVVNGVESRTEGYLYGQNQGQVYS